MNFEFATSGQIVFGRGTIQKAGFLARALGRRAIIVSGRSADRAQKLAAILAVEKIQTTIYSFTGEPSTQTVGEGVALARSNQCDCVIGIGGGSPIDAGKAVAAMLNNPGELVDYLEVIGKGKPLPAPPLPYIAIPTTAGTGSEVTRNAVLSSPKDKVKVSLRSPLMLPRVALIDPELTLGLPPEITASTGLDALTQLIEPYVCNRANPMTDAFCVQGIRRVAHSLRTAFREPANLVARAEMCVASLFGGLALANAGLGAVHGFAGPIGGMFSNAPHGGICAALLPHVIRGNVGALRHREPKSPALGRYAELARLITGEADALPEQLVEWVEKLNVDLKIPGLSAYGMTLADADLASKKAAHASSMKANPVALSHEELVSIFTASL